MATPMTPDETLAALRLWKVPHKTVDGWRERDRDNETGLPFGPVHGFMVHHTASDGADSTNLQVIINGRTGLPGPLSQFGCDDEGIIWLVGNGRANHAGGGDPRVLDAVMAESYSDYPPAPRYHTGSPGATDGNDHFYGVETFYSGAHPPTPDAYASLVLLAAAICHHHRDTNWTSKSVIGHKEWSNWKVDPGGVDMKLFRADVQAALNAGPDLGLPVVNLRRAKRRLQAAREEVAAADRNLTTAIEVGHNVRGVRTRVRQIMLDLDTEIGILERKDG